MDQGNIIGQNNFMVILLDATLANKPFYKWKKPYMEQIVEMIGQVVHPEVLQDSNE